MAVIFTIKLYTKKASGRYLLHYFEVIFCSCLNVILRSLLWINIADISENLLNSQSHVNDLYFFSREKRPGSEIMSTFFSEYKPKCIGLFLLKIACY